ncbi:subtilisin like protease [Trichoderma guizhouense]|uniref:Subtilisin like protease n=1 Tax=Trichoderma guizhouense TaxID=1491466 RepID=A0A1T3CSX2_9HYPO|nr:subtilisin like protease [Trichoderma guizhouense]
MASLLAALSALGLIEAVWAEPTVSFPFNAQLPPVARPNELFSYSLSPNTFRSDFNMTYSLGDHPKWLSIESENLRLYGTPKDEDVPPGEVVGQQFDLIATDKSGSAFMNATLVISRNLPPSIQVPISQQMDNFGQFSAPSSILSYPSTEFHYTFDPNTFGAGENLNYYASTNDNTPLPAWIRFDDKTMTFSGRTPDFESLVQPPQTFDFNLVASDIVGFSGTCLSFAIVVGSHKLSTDDPVVLLNATRGSKASYDGLAKGIQLDSKTIRSGSLNVSVENMPSWLTLDHSTLLLEGTPGGDDHSTKFTVVIQDSFSDSLNVIVQVDVASGVFQSSLEDVKIQPGSDFSLDLSSHFRDPSDIELKVDVDPQESWLQVKGLKVSGNVPKTVTGKFNLSITAISKSTGLTETQVAHADFLSLSEATNTASSSKPTTPASQDSHRHHLSATDVLLATILPVLFIIFAIMMLVCLMRRRRDRRTYLSARKHRPKISDPILFTVRNNDSDVETIYHAEDAIRSQKSNSPQLYHKGDGYRVGGRIRPLRPLRSGTGLFKKGDGIFARVASRVSLRSLTSGKLGGGSAMRGPPYPMASGARSATGSRSLLGDEDHGSWFTVERATVGERSHKSSDSRQSDTTLPEVAQPYLPTSGFLSEAGESAFRSGLDLTLPSFDDLANIQPMPMPPVAQQKSGERATSPTYSTITSSSAALPTDLALIQEPFDPSLVSRAKETARKPLAISKEAGEAAESASEIKQPSQARLPSQTWLSRRGSSWKEGDSINGAKSFRTEPSFGSQENWRVIQRRDPSVAYLELVDETPFLPSRTNSKNNLGQPEERRSLELMSPSKWGEDERKSTIRPMRSTSVLSNGSSSVFGEREALAKARSTTLKTEELATKGSERSFLAFI